MVLYGIFMFLALFFANRINSCSC